MYYAATVVAAAAAAPVVVSLGHLVVAIALLARLVYKSESQLPPWATAIPPSLLMLQS